MSAVKTCQPECEDGLARGEITLAAEVRSPFAWAPVCDIGLDLPIAPAL